MIWLLLSFVSFTVIAYFVAQAPVMEEIEEVEEYSVEGVEYLVEERIF